MSAGSEFDRPGSDDWDIWTKTTMTYYDRVWNCAKWWNCVVFSWASPQSVGASRQHSLHGTVLSHSPRVLIQQKWFEHVTHHDCIQASVCPSELFLQCAPLPAGTQHHMNMAKYGKRTWTLRGCFWEEHVTAQAPKPINTKHVWSTGKLHLRSQLIWGWMSMLKL